MLDENNNVNQSNIIASKVIGRDDNSQIHQHFYSKSIFYKEDLVLKKLLDEHEIEKEKDADYLAFSDELNNFFKQEIGKNLRDLREKLVDGGRENLIRCALDSKERVTKKIHMYSLYKSAQDVYTYLLTNIRSSFKHQVEARIKSGKFETYEIDDIVRDKIIEPFYQAAQGSSLLIDLDELYGILYLLTGNCHIDWD